MLFNVKNLSGQIFIQKRNILISAMLASGFSLAIFYAEIKDWSGPFAGAPFFLSGLIIWIVWAAHLSLETLKSRRNYGLKIVYLRLFVLVLMSLITITIVLKLGGAAGKILYFHRIAIAANAGLQKDCMELLHNWPDDKDIIYPLDPDFKQLPASIKMLASGYVIKESISFTNLAPSVGICTDGFGGFAVGIRVFQDDQDAEKFIANTKNTMKIGKDFGYERIVSGIYYWWQDT